jgi:hypothetical protein
MRLTIDRPKRRRGEQRDGTTRQMAYARFIRHPSSCKGAWQTSVFQRIAVIFLPCAGLAKNASFESSHSY